MTEKSSIYSGIKDERKKFNSTNPEKLGRSYNIMLIDNNNII